MTITFEGIMIIMMVGFIIGMMVGVAMAKPNHP
jgi:hypothetical protein